MRNDDARHLRHGTTTFFSALNLFQGRVIGMRQRQHRHQEWLKFLRLIDAQTPLELGLHLIVENYATHKHPRVRAWLTRHPRFHVHFIPTSNFWLNLIERFFREIITKRIRRGAFHSVAALGQAIRDYLDAHNANPKLFVWTAQLQDILPKIARAHATLDMLNNQ